METETLLAALTGTGTELPGPLLHALAVKTWDFLTLPMVEDVVRKHPALQEPVRHMRRLTCEALQQMTGYCPPILDAVGDHIDSTTHREQFFATESKGFFVFDPPSPPTLRPVEETLPVTRFYLNFLVDVPETLRSMQESLDAEAALLPLAQDASRVGWAGKVQDAVRITVMQHPPRFRETFRQQCRPFCTSMEQLGGVFEKAAREVRKSAGLTEGESPGVMTVGRRAESPAHQPSR